MLVFQREAGIDHLCSLHYFLLYLFAEENLARLGFGHRHLQEAITIYSLHLVCLD
jgi:hypothetical protein